MFCLLFLLSLDFLSKFTLKLSNYSVVNPQVTHRWKRNTKSEVGVHSNLAICHVYFNVTPFSSLPKSETWRGDNIVCIENKQQKTPYTPKKEQVCILLSAYLVLLEMITITLTHIFSPRDFLHPNFAQYSHNSSGNHKSSSQKSTVSRYCILHLVVWCILTTQ